MKSSLNAVKNDAELAAVISAAITAYEQDSGISPNSKLVVRRITRIGGNSWGNAAIAECMKNRIGY